MLQVDLVVVVAMAVTMLVRVLLILVSLVVGVLLVLEGFAFGVLVLLPILPGVVLPLPIGMAPLDPVAMVFVPPVAVVPGVGIVPIAVVVAPIGMILDPLRMMPIHPAAIMVMPPVGIAPFVMIVVVAPSARAAGEPSGRGSYFLPDVGMVLEERAQFRMVLTEILVVDQVGIGGELVLNALMLVQPMVEPCAVTFSPSPSTAIPSRATESRRLR